MGSGTTTGRTIWNRMLWMNRCLAAPFHLSPQHKPPAKRTTSSKVRDPDPQQAVVLELGMLYLLEQLLPHLVQTDQWEALPLACA
eukprot:2337492-Amphidinium_carterae.1